MKTEDKLRRFIAYKYSSLRQFVQDTDLPYSTVVSILKRGVDNASLVNIFKLCDALGISADELAEGRITPRIKENLSVIDFELLIPNLHLDGIPLSEDEQDSLTDAIEISIGLIEKRREKK